MSSVLQHHFDQHHIKAPDLVSLLQDSFYVDDLATAAASDKEANRIYEQSFELMNQGFHLRKWHTNSKNLHAKINVSTEEKDTRRSTQLETESYWLSNAMDTATPGSVPENREPSTNIVKVLGVGCNHKTDTLNQDHSD